MPSRWLTSTTSRRASSSRTPSITCVSILFVGYVLGQSPSNMFLTRTRPSRYMGLVMMVWAIVSALTALSKDFVGLLTHSFLGITEAPRHGLCGLIAAGVFHGMDNLAGLAGWQWLFILQGVITFVIAVVSYFILPDFPTNHELQFTGTAGKTYPISDWDMLPQAAKDALENTSFGSANVPFKDANLDANLAKATL